MKRVLVIGGLALLGWTGCGGTGVCADTCGGGMVCDSVTAQCVVPDGGAGGGTGGGLGGGAGGGTGGGTGGGAAPPPCISNSYWTQGNRASPNMNPGLACRNCHATQAPSRMYPLMGTVFPAPNQVDTCNAAPPSGVVVVEIIQNGIVVASLTPLSPSGNFYSFNSISGSYTARVRANGKTNAMTTPQTEGDCNACHTVSGANGAPGRIYWPQ